MKNLRTIILIAGILVAGLAYNSVAQGNPEKTKSAKEVKVLKHEKNKHKDKHKEHKFKAKPHDKQKDKHKAKAHRQKSDKDRVKKKRFF